MYTENELVTLTHARKHYIPKREDGKNVSPSTVWRWIRKGLAGTNGERIRLSITYVGRTPYVTREDVERFFSAVTEATQARHQKAEQQVLDVTDEQLRRVGL